MTDIASLGYKIDSSGAVSATKDLNAMSEAAKKAETSAAGLSGGARKAETAVDALGKDARTTAGALDAAAAAGAKASSATSSLELKAREAGMTLAGYELHLQRAAKDQALLAAEARQTALAVQRSNAAIASTPARVSGGAGMPVINGGSIQAAESGVAKAANSTRLLTRNLVSASAATAMLSGDMGRIGTAAAVAASSIDATAAAALLFTPIGLAMAAAVALAGGAFVLFKSDCDKAADNDAFVKSLGLSDKELKRLGNTSVTTGDVLKGFWRTIDQDGKVSKTFKDIADTGVGAFRAVLEGVEWFVAGAYAGLNAVAKAMKGVAMVATGDFAGFDYFNHSLDNLISDTKAAKASMDQFWASVKQNTIAVNHERVAASAAAIKAERDVKAIKAGTDDRFKVRGGTDYEFSRGAITKAGETLGKDTWADIKVPSIVITSVDELAKALGGVSEKYSAIKDASREFSKSVGDAFYDAATGADGFFHSLTGGLARLAAQWAAADIEHILNKLFKVDDSDTYQKNPLSGIGDSIAGWFGGGSKSPSYDGGGYTGNGSRSGGIDGKGGFWAVMHPQETVTDHTKPGGSSFDPREMAMAFIGHLTSELDRRASANRNYSDAKISGFNRALPKRLGQIQRQGT